MNVLTSITKSHWIEFIIRSCVFVLTLVGYLVDVISNIEIVKQISHWVIGIYFTYQMVSRLIPNKKHSMGNQKVFGRNYTQIEDIKEGIKGYKTTPDRYSLHYRKQGNRVALAVGIVWLLLTYGAMNRANGRWRQPIVCMTGCAFVCMQRILFPTWRVFLGLPSRHMLVWRSDQRAWSCVFVFLMVVAR